MTVKAIVLPLDGVLFQSTNEEYEQVCLRMEAEYVEPAVARAARVAASGLAGDLRDPALSNHSFLQDVMLRELRITPTALDRINSEFYEVAFPNLRAHSILASGVPELLSVLEERALSRAILADVCFPEHAALQRLSWADLSVESWEFVAHSENTHFDPASPALFTEIVARLGVEPDEALFVGESGTPEINSALAAGLPVYEVFSATLQPNRECVSGGTLSELVIWLEAKWQVDLPSRPITSKQILVELQGNLGALFGMLADVAPVHWHLHPLEDEWSIMQIICHLLERERTEQLPRLRRILLENAPFIVAPPPPPGPEIEPCMEDGFRVAEDFKSARLETLSFLLDLESDDWLRPARHSIFGPTTLLEMAHFTAQHDRLHLNQLCQTLGECD